MSNDQLGHDAQVRHFAAALDAIHARLTAIRKVADAAAVFAPGIDGDRWVGPDEAHGRNVVGEEILAIIDGGDE